MTAQGWSGLRVEHAELAPHESETRTGPFQVGVAFSSHEDVRYRVGDGPVRSATYAGGVVVATSDEGIVWSRVREPTEALEIYPDPALVARLSGGVTSWPIPEALVGRNDPVVLGVAARIRRALATGRPVPDVEADALACLLVGHLLTAYAGVPRSSLAGLNTGHTLLSPAALGAVADVVEAGLATGLSLEALAAAVHLSPFHFARAFKASTGTTPWEYVTTRRMDRARLLLRTTTTPVSQVAEAVGMGNVSHFRRLFAAYTGCSPGRYRALVR